jgi:hypothetical protein
MALLKYYNSKIHDLYLYDRLATTTQSSIPVGYNPDCQSYGIADFSGCCARNRHFCTLIGITYGVQFDRENVNFWNCCAYRGVLISPKHMIICEHFRGPRPDPNDNTSGIVLLGKSGIRHTVKVVAVTLSIGFIFTIRSLILLMFLMEHIYGFKILMEKFIKEFSKRQYLLMEN